MAESGDLSSGLRYSTSTARALCLCYAMTVRNLDEEQRTEFDGWVTATAADVLEWTEQQKKDKMDTIRAIGEVG